MRPTLMAIMEDPGAACTCPVCMVKQNPLQPFLYADPEPFRGFWIPAWGVLLVNGEIMIPNATHIKQGDTFLWLPFQNANIMDPEGLA